MTTHKPTLRNLSETREALDHAIEAAFPERWMIDAAISRGELGKEIADHLPEAGALEALLLAAEEVDNSWEDDEGTVRWREELWDRLVALRRAHNAYEGGG